jgi:choline dehydrogenase-like flavoprotein
MYICAQFVGGAIGMAISGLLLGQVLTHESVNHVMTVYGAALLRMREFDFGEVRHFGGVSPAWPLSYADMEPFYTRAEQFYNVHGQRGKDRHRFIHERSRPQLQDP